MQDPVCLCCSGPFTAHPRVGEWGVYCSTECWTDIEGPRPPRPPRFRTPADLWLVMSYVGYFFAFWLGFPGRWWRNRQLQKKLDE